MKDRVFAGEDYPQVFEFSSEVSEAFDDMVHRSIPFYEEIVRQTTYFAKSFYKPQTRLIDLGCSTANVLRELSNTLEGRAELIGVDRSADMVRLARTKLVGQERLHHIEIYETDAVDFQISNASVVIANFLLPFLKLGQRRDLLSRVYEGLVPGGVLLLSEKVRSDNCKVDEFFSRQHEERKRQNGYSDIEIFRKKRSLENVLVPLTLLDEVEMLEGSGFGVVEIFFKWNNFVSLLALKV